MAEWLECEVLHKLRYINTLTFTFTLHYQTTAFHAAILNKPLIDSLIDWHVCVLSDMNLDIFMYLH